MFATVGSAPSPSVTDVRRTQACIADFCNNDPVLNDPAANVRSTEIGRPHLTPLPPGLSALYANDHEMLEHDTVIYDAHYSLLKRGSTEVHNAALFVKK
jgi:hypothetical protein